MAVTAATLMAPEGEIESSFFPDEDSTAIEARLTKYIADGMTRAAALDDPSQADTFVTYWAYHRAYSAVYKLMSAAPASLTFEGQMSGSMLITQIENFKDLAADNRVAAEAMLPVATKVKPESLGSQAVNTRVKW